MINKFINCSHRFLQLYIKKSSQAQVQNDEDKDYEEWRDFDYLVQTNFLAFLVLWKDKRYQTARNYIQLTKKYIYQMINQTNDDFDTLL